MSAAPHPNADAAPLIEALGLTKIYGSLVALDHADMAFRRDDIGERCRMRLGTGEGGDDVDRGKIERGQLWHQRLAVVDDVMGAELPDPVGGLEP